MERVESGLDVAGCCVVDNESWTGRGGCDGQKAPGMDTVGDAKPASIVEGGSKAMNKSSDLSIVC